MSRRKRLNFILASTFVCTCLLVSSVRADTPVIELSAVTVENEIVANCGDFLIIANGTGTNRLTTYFDNNGNPIRVHLQGRYNGTMTNSITGYSLADAPSVANIFVDLVTGTQANIGAFFTVTAPGEGVILFYAGRIVFDGQGPPVFIAGPHHPSAETRQILCNALS
jgi:hypothetical protein